MGRKDLEEDVAGCNKIQFQRVVDVRLGDDKETVFFTYLSESLPTGLANIQALIPEPREYPKSHQYFLFVDNQENVPPAVTQVLEEISPLLNAKPLPQVIQEVSQKLTGRLSAGQKAHPIEIADDESEPEAFGEDSDVADDFDEDFTEAVYDESDDDALFGSGETRSSVNPLATSRRKPDSFARVEMSRIRSDLLTAKQAGFKVGILGKLSGGGMVCVSIRVVKLGISEEAMQAWGLHRKQYLVLMIRFSSGYHTLEQVSEANSLSAHTSFKVALCNRYKPTFADALLQFAEAKKSERRESIQADAGHGASTPSSSSLEPLFIGGPLNELFKVRFPTILRSRLASGIGWTGAEMHFDDIQGKAQSGEVMDDKYYVSDDVHTTRALKSVVTADAISDSLTPLSLPLVAMQFLLRHFVRCTEFCLVCHCKVEGTFEALKPYVCSKPLCLYQYINLGFGPSIEWEIMTQPFVVDLLISFCYASARNGRLKDFPIGLDLNVPVLPHYIENDHSKKPRGKPECSFVATYNQDKQELSLDARNTGECPVKKGTWVLLKSKSIDVQIHCQVVEDAYYPKIGLGSQTFAVANATNTATSETKYMKRFNTLPSQASTAPTPPSADEIPDSLEVECFAYDNAFDLLSDAQKHQSISTLLDTLPSVKDMQKHLNSGDQGQHPTLRGRVTEPALNLLRWIIASNRSCILQVECTLEKHLSGTSTPQASSLGLREDPVSGMDNWYQFRFAQGAPDKEQRFVDSVNNVTAMKPYPTLFAWHGSPLSNWHSIIREGLHFNEQLHGRAFGHGVYMSPQAQTSMGYSGMHSFGARGSTGFQGASVWPQSVLRISQALSLQEVVNAPAQFINRTPHYVVDKIDWIQTRYLLVKGGDSEQTTSTTASVERAARVYEQDPSAMVYDISNRPIQIPLTAISKSRRPAVTSVAQKSLVKKAKSLFITDEQTAEEIEDDANSILTSTSDRQIFEGSDDDDDSYGEVMDIDEDTPAATSRTGKRSSDSLLGKDVFSEGRAVSNPSTATPQTDFIPGALDRSKFKMLKEPTEASVSTTKALATALKETQKVQKGSPAHELGWYIDGAMVDNLYQWIVELHSFDPSLPLAKDMKRAKLTSIVLELRFMNNFPYSPPFVRVVRPRFLAFNAGGGGHVTAGGAICMELLTNSGWLPSNSIESVLLQVRMAMSSLEPKPARLEPDRYGGVSSYSVGEAIEAYKRACHVHGWQIPREFHTLQQQE